MPKSNHKQDPFPEENAPICFVIMPFRDPPGYPKDHFRKIYDQIFKPAIEAAGYQALRCDEIHNGKSIHSNMFRQLSQAPLVLCDLTGHNPNVLYELGRRDALNLPSVLVLEEGQERLFNLREYSAVPYRKSRYYDEVPEDQAKIKDAILQTTLANEEQDPILSSDPLPARNLRTQFYRDWDVEKQRKDSPGIQVGPSSSMFLRSFAEDRLVTFLVSAREFRQRIVYDKAYARKMLDELNELMADYEAYCNSYDQNFHDAEDLREKLEISLRIFRE